MIYTNGQIIFSLFYLFTMIISSIIFGYLCSIIIKDSTVHRMGLFAIGSSFTPCIIGTWMMFFSFIPNFRNKQFYCLFLYLILLAMLLKKFWYSIKDNFRSLVYFCRNNTIMNVWFIGIICIFGWYSLSISGYQVNFDASFYMAEALKYVKDMSFHHIATHKDFYDGTLPGSVHNFLWPGYLSFALLFSENGDFGLNHDLSVYFAFILAGLYLISALWGAIVSITDSIKLACVGSLSLVYTPFFTMLRMSSRDLFRSIPILLLISLLYFDLKCSSTVNKNRGFDFILLLCCYYLVGGHPINIFTGGIIGIVWLVLCIVKKKVGIHIIRKTFFMMLGVFIGAYNFIYAIVDTGNISGNCSLYSENIYQGTSILEVANQYFASTMIRNNRFSDIINKIFEGDRYRVCTIAALCSIVLIVIFLLKREINIMIPMVYTCSYILIALGRFISWGNFTYSEWLTRNKRYSYHFYTLAILCIALMIFEISCFFVNHMKCFHKYKKIVDGLVIATICLFFFPMLFSIDVQEKKDFELTYYQQHGAIVYSLYKELPENDNMIIAENTWSYITDVNAKVLASHFGEPLFQAEDINDVWSFLKNNNIRYICLNSDYLSLFWKDSVFYNSILSLRDEGLLTEMAENVFEVDGENK